MREAGTTTSAARCKGSTRYPNVIGKSRSKLPRDAARAIVVARRLCRMKLVVRAFWHQSRPNIITSTMLSRPVGLSLPIRVRRPAVRWRNECFHREVRCSSSSKHLPISENQKGPNTEQLPHISEETASVAKIMGRNGPDLSQGTMVQEVR
jgi:hypothetical protein